MKQTCSQPEEKKRDHYDSISTETRRLLVKLTQQDGISIRKASRALQIKYSTGKTLIQLYKKTGRIDRVKMQRTKLTDQRYNARNIIQMAITQKKPQDSDQDDI
jgi:transposase